MSDKNKSDKEKKKKKPSVYDDGRTIVDMNVDGMPWYNPNRTDRKKVDKKDKPTFKEKFAMIMGAYRATIISVLCIVLGLTLAMLLIALWLK
ncbi:MAG: hypothetical protein NC099_01850 [Corallococcus sp.]|nr:hypothetical protein [Bacillota bacterium]MCM1533374.1 hypothetical protein [Corallococcus sp.]